MLQQKLLDLKGSFANYPFAEVLAEVRQAGLSGSLRVNWGERKSVVYFDEGAVVHAVSNARAFRLFSILLERKRLEAKDLSGHKDFADDIRLFASLREKEVFTDEELESFAREQNHAVLVDLLTWPEGQWLFSPLARIKTAMMRRLDYREVLLAYARGLTPGFAAQRFKSVSEKFELLPIPDDAPALQPHEAFLLTRFEDRPLRFDEIRSLAGMPDTEAAHTIYVLWLGGLLSRSGWNAAFSQARIDEIRRTRITLVKAATNSEQPKLKPLEDTAENIEAETREPLIEITLTIGEYLDRVERAETLYDVLGVTAQSKTSEIKASYFSMAKLFHPDKYHREAPETLRRVQHAFTELAHAYEVLKNQQSRESYDLKVKKEQETKRRAAENSGAAIPDSGVGFESFQQGLEFLNDGDSENAAKCFARAVHYTPNNAAYHAYFGKALSSDERHKHRAEAELQSAVRLDPRDAKIRMMLVEFLLAMKLNKRAEGELRRFLDTSPGHPQAEKMLADLQR
jgi:tetratricopeptide (TPR) repeat protein